MSLRRIPVAVTATLAAFTLAACGSPGDPEAAATADGGDGGITVVASTNVYGAIARAVGGDAVTVDSIIDDPAADPHSYESTPADAAAVARADVVIVNGGGYDEFMTRLVETSGATPVVLNAVELSGLDGAEEAGHADDEHAGESPEEHAAHEGADDHAHEGEEAHDHGEFNEHVWYSLPTVQALATQLATELGTLDADDAATFTANTQTFDDGVQALLDRTAAIGPSVPGARIAVTEPVPGWLLETAGLTDVTPPAFSEAVEEDTDPPAAVLAETLALFAPDAPQPMAALIVNAQTETATTGQVTAAAQQVGVPVLEMTETLPEGQDDYLAWMGAQVDALSGALNPV